MPSRPAIPAPKPLSPRAAAYVSELFEQANARQAAFVKAYDAGVAAAQAPVRKAPKNDPVAIYDADGNLVGTCDPDEITMLAPAKAPDAPDSPPTDLEAAPAASVGTPADAVPAAKAMSLGAKGQHQLGGKKPGPAAGVPVAPAEPVEEDAEVTKARVQVMSAELKKSLSGGTACSAPEQNRLADAMNAAALAKYQEMRQRGQVGAPRRP